jgi:hypothetical protein
VRVPACTASPSARSTSVTVINEQGSVFEENQLEDSPHERSSGDRRRNV